MKFARYVGVSCSLAVIENIYFQSNDDCIWLCNYISKGLLLLTE